MGIGNKLMKGIREPKKFATFGLRTLGVGLSDETYLKWMYRIEMGKKLHLDPPKTFNEKLQWLKLHDHRPEYTIMVDKVKAKEYVAEKIGAQYIIPTLGVWDSPDEIDFDALPNQFVLKCNHNSGGLIICKDKQALNIKKAKALLRRELKKDFYKMHREWPYKDVPRKILAEQFMVDESGSELKDYKVFNFNGEPEIIQVDYGRFMEHKRNIYDKNWNLMDLEIQYASDKNHKIDRPKALEEMLNLARILSEGIPHVRTDFYSIGDKLYWGELTFYHGAGLEKFRPENWNERLGRLIILPPPYVKNCYIVNRGYILCIKVDKGSKHEGSIASVGGLRDYKFFCFNGEPKLCQVISDRATDESIDFFDQDWNRMVGLVGLSEHTHNGDSYIPKPKSFELMKKLAASLSKDIPFLRVDFYDIGGKPYFGEMTFYPAAGMGYFRPDEWNYTLGDWVRLPA